MSEPPSRGLSDQARPLAAALIRPQQRYPSPPGQEARGRERRRTPLDCDILSDAVSSASIVDENITYAAHGNSPRPEAQESPHDDVTGQGDLDIPDADSSNRSPSRSLHLPPKASQQNQPTASNAGCNDSAVSYSLSLSIVSQLRTPSHSPHNWLLSQEIPSQPPRRRIRSVSNIPNNIIALRLANPEYQLQGLDTVKSPRGLATFQCRLCPKRFTRAYHLRSHLRTHTERPFVCTICGKSFARQHDRKQHEGLHSGEKVFVCRGDLSDGNPWGCGRRFATVDALGRHFQTEAGRICLKSLWEEENRERNQGQDVQEHPTNLKSCPPPSEVFTLPVRLLAQYPALAHSSMDTSDYTSSHDSGYVSDPGYASDYGAGSATISCNDIHVPSSPIVKQPSRALYDDAASQFTTEFARRLAYRSGAHTWGESVLARLDYVHFIDQFKPILSAALNLLDHLYLFIDQLKPFLTTYLDSSGSVKEILHQLGEDVCVGFYAEMKSDHSGHEMVSTDVEAMAPFAELNESCSGVSSKMTSSVNSSQDHARLRSVAEIVATIVSTDHFEKLSQTVRRELYSSSTQSSDHAWEALKNYHRQTIDFTINTHLNLFDYIKQNFSHKPVELSTLVTITGTAFYAYATTCRGYLRLTWPTMEDILLPMFQDAIREIHDRPHSTAKIVRECGHQWTIFIELCQDGTLKLRAKAYMEFAVGILEQLCWLNTAFSTPPPGQGEICYCTPRLECIGAPILGGLIFKLEVCFAELHATERNSCWLSLFSNAVIAHGFPIPKRADGMGLEMSVELMAGIIGARHAATFDGGVVIRGFSSMFVPVMWTRDGIQWHYVSSGDPDMQISYKEGVEKCPNRILSSDLNVTSLATARCFIGWNGLVDVRVANEMNNFDNIEFSDAAEVKASLQIPGASLGFQQFGFAQIDVTFGKRDGKCHFQRNSSYRRIVAASDRMLVALFDTGERRSCLVPASGLLLHILRHRLALGLGGVPSSKVKILSSGSFTDTLLGNAKLRLTPEEDEPLFVDEVVSEIWSVLELLQAQSISAENNSKVEIHATWQERLLGYEYKAVVEDRSPIPLKELEIRKTCGGWPRLVRDVNALVLLASGLGDLIRPIDNQAGVCRQWETLPRGKDYMAVPVKVLLGLYSLAGCRETKKRLTATNLALHSRDTVLFQPCPTPKERQCSCDRLQQVVSISSFGQICVPEIIDGDGDGAVIIGESGSWLKRFKKRSTPKTTEMLSHAKVVSDAEASASYNSDTSRSFIGSDSSDFRHSNTSSPDSSVVDDSEASPNNLDSMGTRLFSFCHRKRSLSEMAGPLSTLPSSPMVLSPRLVKQRCLGQSLCGENLRADKSR